MHAGGHSYAAMIATFLSSTSKQPVTQRAIRKMPSMSFYCIPRTAGPRSESVFQIRTAPAPALLTLSCPRRLFPGWRGAMVRMLRYRTTVGWGAFIVRMQRLIFYQFFPRFFSSLSGCPVSVESQGKLGKHSGALCLVARFSHPRSILRILPASACETSS